MTGTTADPRPKPAPDDAGPRQQPASERDAEALYGEEALARRDREKAEGLERLSRLVASYDFQRRFDNQGAAAFGEHARSYQSNTFFFGRGSDDQPEEPRGCPLDADDIAHDYATYAKAGGHEQLVERLRAQHVLFLTGPCGSGRRATAKIALAEALHGRVSQACRPDCARGHELADLVLDPKSSLNDLLSWEPAKRCGYLLKLNRTDLADAITTAWLGGMRGLLRSRHAYLLVMTDDLAAQAGPYRDFIASHQPPPPLAVLTAHLVHALSQRRAAELAADAEVRAHLATISSPHEAKDLADELIARESGGQQPDVSAWSSSRLKRSILGKLLDGALPAGDAGGPDDPAAWIELRKRAFLITAGFLDGHRLTEALDATDRLVTTLRPDRSPHVPTVQERLGFQTTDLLSFLPGSGTDQETARITAASPRRIRLAGPKLIDAIVDVCWNDLAGLRTPLLHWLCDLAESDPDRSSTVWRSAAQMIGRLATYDFPPLLRTIIRPWAASPRRCDREAAAAALEVAVFDESVRPDIQRLLTGWITSGAFTLQYTALLAYQSELSRLFPGDARAGLIRLGEDGRYARTGLVSFAFGNLADLFTPGDLLRQLSAWAASTRPHQPAQAARCLAVLARHLAAAPRASWPLLLDAAEREPMLFDALVTIWRSGLHDKYLRVQLWRRLGAWLRCADNDPRCEPPLLRLVNALARDSAIRKRMLFHLHCWRHSAPASFLDLLITELERG